MPSIRLRHQQNKQLPTGLHNKGRGTLKMATGSGKTITALAIACELYTQNWFASLASSLPLPAFGQPMVARMSEIWSQTSLSF